LKGHWFQADMEVKKFIIWPLRRWQEEVCRGASSSSMVTGRNMWHWKGITSKVICN
jgi:hypothetical protein